MEVVGPVAEGATPVDPPLLLPDETTPEAFIRGMTQKVPTGYAEMSTEQRAFVRERLAFAGQRTIGKATQAILIRGECLGGLSRAEIRFTQVAKGVGIQRVLRIPLAKLFQVLAL